jgi:hypothetical protein
LTALSAKPSLRCAPAKQRLILFSGTSVLMFIRCGRMKVRNVLVAAQRPGTDANFAVVVVVFTTKPAAMAVAVLERGKILKISRR